MEDNAAYGLTKKLSVIVLVLMSASAFARGQSLNPFNCLNTGNYTANSTYATNLNATLASLSSNMTDNGFRNTSVGQGQDRANAVALCRGDVSLERCLRCVENAAVELVDVCPNQKQAIRWYEWCMLHYSNVPIQGDVENGPGTYLINSQDVTNPAQFRADRTTLLNALREQAANGSSLIKAGAGTRGSSDGDTVYALLQCVPILSAGDCNDCLIRATQSFGNQQGERALQPSCNARYELYSFYNETRLRELNVSVLQMLNPPPETGGNSTRSKKDDKTLKIVVSIVVPVVVCVALAICATIFYLRKRKKPKTQKIGETAEDISTVESLQYDFRRISAATQDFADGNKLGQGGFGAVYRGKLADGQEVAVKRLSKESGQGDMEFKNEALLLARLQHRNLVRLLGFSLQGTERLLIYEFAPNGSLDQFLFDPIKKSLLDWERRYKIIAGIARGVLYLHEDSRLRIIHRDLKASNILLDAEMLPKIADFGMARLFGRDETQGNTSKIVGTYGYMSPEYAIYGQFSVKSDVFSFGVLVLEIISGRKNLTYNGDNIVEDLISFAWKNWHGGRAENVIDPVLRRGGVSIRDLLRCMHIGLLCIQEDAHERPTMNTVGVMLNSSTVTLPMPSQPAFVISTRFGSGNWEHRFKDDSNSGRAANVKMDVSDSLSKNEMSVTEIYPR